MALKLKPQVVFVDIEMPQLTGMDAVRELLEKIEDLVVIFVTAHADFAVEAFEISSFDYILKPFKADRVEKTLEKIRKHFSEKEVDLGKLYNMFKSTEKLCIKSGYELHFIDTDSIYYIEKDRKKTVIHTTGGTHETNESISDLTGRLNATNFFRSHKCYLINLQMIQKIVPWGDNSYLVKFFNSNNDALISRAKVKMLYDLLEIGT